MPETSPRIEKASDRRMGEISRFLQREIRREGADAASLEAALIGKKGCSPEEAGMIVQAVIADFNRRIFPAITGMELMVTGDCNHRCDYCFIEEKSDRERMSEKTALEAVDFLFRHSREEKELKILFFGGEPLLEYPLIKKTVLYAEEKARRKKKNIGFEMTTNATLLDRDRTSFLAEHSIRFLVSIDGDEETHNRHRKLLGGKNSYRAVAERLPLMKEHQPWLGARMTVHTDTVKKLSANVRHLAGLGFNQFLIGPATGLEWSENDLDLYLEEMTLVARWLEEELERGRSFRVNTLEESVEMLGGKRDKWGCRAGRHRISVTGTGEVFPCSKMKGVNGARGIFRLGNLTEGMTEINRRMLLCGIIPVQREERLECRWRDSCLGGCFATNYQATGSIFKPSPHHCRLKTRSMELARRAGEILGDDYFDKSGAGQRMRSDRQ